MFKGKFTFMLENYKEQGLKKLSALDEGWDEMMAAVNKKYQDEKGTGTFDKKKVSTGTVYSKKVNKDGSSKMKEEVDLDEELKGKQHKIDKNKNGKIDAEDFKMLRKEEEEQEEFEQLEEGERSSNYIGTVHKSDPDYANKLNALKSQAIGGHRIRGRSPAPEHKEKYQAGGELKRPHQDIKPEHATRVDVYGRKGVKNAQGVSEGASQEDFVAELEKTKKKAEGKDTTNVAKPAVQAVKNEQVEERTLTDVEMKKREEIVKSMKKGIQGFKSRYGDRAKEVMYATATKQAKKD